VREVLDRDPAQLHVATLIRELLCGPGEQAGSGLAKGAPEALLVVAAEQLDGVLVEASLRSLPG
jgi:hypothetical protein